MDETLVLAHRLVVISTGPENMFGAAKAHSSYLYALRSLGAQCVVVTGLEAGPRIPGNFQGALPEDRRIVSSIRSDAYPECGVVRALAVGEEIYRLCVQHTEAGASVLLLGTYLFPFCWSVLHAARMLHSAGVAAKVVIVPAGSDIWQIGHQLRRSAAAILKDPLVSSRVTYSRTFADEIAQSVAEGVDLRVIPPAIDTEYFRPSDSVGRNEVRQRLAIPSEAVVLVSCSNMRPIKNLGITLSLARRLAKCLRVEVELLLVGPMTTHLRKSIGRFWPTDVRGAHQDYSWRNLKVRFFGLQMDARPYHWASDFAVNTSSHDSFNISLAESLACGLPILSTDVVGVKELPGADEVGFFFSMAEAGQLGEAQAEGVRCEVSSIPDIEAILEWVEPLVRGRETWRMRKAAARVLAESQLAPGVVREMWRLLLSDLHIAPGHP